MLKTIDKRLLFIIFLGLALRYVGLRQALPYVFHPDEPTIIRSALGVRFFPNPKHFDWPHLYIYVNYVLYMALALFRRLLEFGGLKNILEEIFPLLWNDSAIFYYLTRVLSATLGALTSIPIYLSGKKLFNEKVGLLAALAIAVTPFHVWHSHYALSDVPMAFFASWVLYFSSFILFRSETKHYIYAGFFVGLAATTKYNGALTALFVVFAHLIRVFFEKDEKLINIKSFFRLILSGLFSILAFLIGTPYALLDYKTFIRTDGPKGALWQFTNVGSVSGMKRLNNFFSLFTEKLLSDFGYTLLILFILCVFYLLYVLLVKKEWNTHRDLLFLSVVSVALLIYVSGIKNMRSHYFFMIYPPIILSAVGFLSKVFVKYQKVYVNLVWMGVLSLPLFFSMIGSYTFYRTDTRIMLENWLEENYQGQKIYFISGSLTPILDKKGTKMSDDDKKFSSGALLITGDLDRTEYNLIKSFDNNLRKGPVINIYKIQ